MSVPLNQHLTIAEAFSVFLSNEVFSQSTQTL